MFIVLMSRYFPVTLCVTLCNCHTWTEAPWNNWPYVSLPSITNIRLYNETFKWPYMYFCTIFIPLMSWFFPVALCVTLGHCHTWTEAAWNHWPYVSLPSNEEPCIVFWNLLVALCVTLGHCHTWTEAAWNGWPYVSLPSMRNLVLYFETF